MGNLLVEEKFLNAGNYDAQGRFMDPDEEDANGEPRYTSRQTSRHRFGDSPVHETWTDNKGQLFLELQREYGACTGAVYIDRTDDNGKATVKKVGWVFVKKMQYEDSGEYGRPKLFYKREVWVTVHTAEPTKTVEYHYAEL